METVGRNATRVGFIGLGRMGRPMAENILKAGYPLTVYNRTATKVHPLVALGARHVASPAALAAESDVVVTMLSDSPDVVEVLTRDDGLLAGANPGLVWIDMSTISPSTARELGRIAESKNVRCLDAPVSGGPSAAADGTLSIMVGGSPDVFDAYLPLIETMGKTITYLGELGSGQVTKACNQIVVAAYLIGIAEALVFGAKGGVDPAKVRQALLGGFGQSKVLDLHGQRMIEHSFQPGFTVGLHRKDLRIVLDTASLLGAATPLSAMALDDFESLIKDGHGDLDNSAIVTVYERWASRSLSAAHEA